MSNIMPTMDSLAGSDQSKYYAAVATIVNETTLTITLGDTSSQFEVPAELVNVFEQLKAHNGKDNQDVQIRPVPLPLAIVVEGFGGIKISDQQFPMLKMQIALPVELGSLANKQSPVTGMPYISTGFPAGSVMVSENSVYLQISPDQKGEDTPPDYGDFNEPK